MYQSLRKYQQNYPLENSLQPALLCVKNALSIVSSLGKSAPFSMGAIHSCAWTLLSQSLGFEPIHQADHAAWMEDSIRDETPSIYHRRDAFGSPQPHMSNLLSRPGKSRCYVSMTRNRIRWATAFDFAYTIDIWTCWCVLAAHSDTS